MLNQFKIGTKLTVGFVSILVLLVVVAGVAYYALDASEKATQEMLEVEKTVGNLVTFRVHVNRAMLRAVQGSLFRDPRFQAERQVIDREIDELERTLTATLSEANQGLFRNLVAEYNTFRNDNDMWFDAEARRVVAGRNLVEAATQATNALEASIRLFREEAANTIIGEGDDARV